jgi:hypothetical protein
MASDLEEAPLRVAQSSKSLIMVCGSLNATSGSLPVAGRPRPLFLGITFIDLGPILGLYLNLARAKRGYIASG